MRRIRLRSVMLHVGIVAIPLAFGGRAEGARRSAAPTPGDGGKAFTYPVGAFR